MFKHHVLAVASVAILMGLTTVEYEDPLRSPLARAADAQESLNMECQSECESSKGDDCFNKSEEDKIQCIDACMEKCTFPKKKNEQACAERYEGAVEVCNPNSVIDFFCSSEDEWGYECDID